MEYQFGLDECFCYKCGKLIKDGQQKLRVTLSLEKVIVGESINEVLRTTHIPSICLSCTQEIYTVTKIPENVFIFPRIDEPILFPN